MHCPSALFREAAVYFVYYTAASQKKYVWHGSTGMGTLLHNTHNLTLITFMHDRTARCALVAACRVKNLSRNQTGTTRRSNLSKNDSQGSRSREKGTILTRRGGLSYQFLMLCLFIPSKTEDPAIFPPSGTQTTHKHQNDAPTVSYLLAQVTYG